MTDTIVLMTDMAILVGIFLLGLLAKMFPKTGKNHTGGHHSLVREHETANKR